MDERQTQIREGAGLEESRLNTDFIEFLRVWGPRLLIVTAVILGGFAAWRYYKQGKIDKVNRVFDEYNQIVAGGDPTPESLIAFAEANPGTRAIHLRARLQAADAYMGAVYSRLEVGTDTRVYQSQTGLAVDPRNTDFDAEGNLLDDSLLLDDAAVEDYLGRAEEQYRIVLERSEGRADYAIHALGAMFGLAAVAESREEYDSARAQYERIAGFAAEHEYAPVVKLADAKIEGLEALRTMPTLYARADLPAVPEPVEEPVDEPVDGSATGDAVDPAPVDPANTDPGSTEPGAADPGADEPGSSEPTDPPATDPAGDPPPGV